MSHLKIRRATWTAITAIGFTATVAAALMIAFTWGSDASGAEAQGPTANSAPLPAITYDQLESAIAATKSCAESAGLTVTVTPGEGLRPTSIGYLVPAPDPESGSQALVDAGATMGDCRARFFNDAEFAWLKQHAYPSDAAVRALYDSINSCAASGGAPGEDMSHGFGSTTYANAPAGGLQISPENLKYFGGCAMRAYAETGLQPPLPPDVARP